MSIDYSGLISEGGRAALSSLKNMPPDQQRAKMNDMLANGLLPFSVALAVDKQLRQPMKENAPSPRPGSVMSEKMAMLQNSGAGIDQLPVPTVDQAEFAGGGIIAFDEGGTTLDPFAGLAGMLPTDKRYPYLQLLRENYEKNKKVPSLEDERANVDKQQREGKYGKYSEALANYGKILEDRQKGIDEAGDERKARRAGWLAMAQAGAEGKGLLAGATAGLAKHAEVSEAREEKRKTELRELQKEQYTLQLGLEQARASGDQQAQTQYLAALDRNAKAQEGLIRGLGTLYEIQSKEDIAAKDRAMQGRKDQINERYGTAIWQLQQRLDNPATTPGEAERLTAQIKTLRERWRADNEAVGAASVYRADRGADSAEAANIVKLMNSEPYVMAEAEANSAKAAYQKATNPQDKAKLLEKYMAAQAKVDALLAQVRGGAPAGGGSAEAGLAGAGAPRQPNGKYAQ